jgi:hypothetical protein
MQKTLKQRIGSVAAIAVVFGLVLSPAIASAATQSSNTTINATIGSTISITSGPTVSISLTPTAGGVVSSSSDTVSVSTNNAAGYVLTLADSDATTNLVNGGNNIPAHAGTQGTPTALANDTWGYRVDTVGGFGSGSTSAETNNGSSTTTWAGVPATGAPNTLKTTATTASGDTTTVWYGVKATTAKPNGVYTDTVTYTATTN